MKEKYLKFFNGLKPKQKGLLVLMAMGVALMVVGVAAYISSSSKPANKGAVESKKDVVSMDTGLLDQSQLLEAQKEAQVAKAALSDSLKAEEERKKQEALGLLAPPPGMMPSQPGSLPPQQFSQNKVAPANLPPLPQPGGFPMPPPPPTHPQMSGGGMPPVPPAPIAVTLQSEVGGIAIVNGVERKADKDDDKKKDDKRSVYLPISYMEATLLSGLDAPTSSDAKGNPVPVLIRVKTPAVLPNDVKANLKGCFVVADGKGNLGTERAELVLVALSCLDRKGQAVIDQPLTGYVVDADGKAGLRGRVVTKMGAMISRSMIAGLFGGFGEVITSASSTTSMSALGSVSQIKSGDLAAAGLGKGLSGAFKEIQKFYLELASQTMPVVEIGAARPITIVVTKGTTLEIKKIRGGK